MSRSGLERLAERGVEAAGPRHGTRLISRAKEEAHATCEALAGHGAKGGDGLRLRRQPSSGGGASLQVPRESRGSPGGMEEILRSARPRAALHPGTSRRRTSPDL